MSSDVSVGRQSPPPAGPRASWTEVGGFWVGVATAVGTLLAVSVALWLAWRANTQQNDLEIQQREAQARRIAGWLEHEPVESGPDAPQRLVMVVKNGSDLPAFNVIPNVYVPQQQMTHGVNMINVLPPGETRRIPLLPGQYIPKGGDSPLLTLSFDDAEGRRWARDSRGALELVSLTPIPIHPPGDSPISNLPEGR